MSTKSVLYGKEDFLRYLVPSPLESQMNLSTLCERGRDEKKGQTRLPICRVAGATTNKKNLVPRLNYSQVSCELSLFTTDCALALVELCTTYISSVETYWKVCTTMAPSSSTLSQFLKHVAGSPIGVLTLQGAEAA
jgi:hypothetical protein